MKVLVLDREVLVLVLNTWSWSRSLEKVLQFFKTYVAILDVSEQGKPWHFVRDKKAVCHSEAIV